MFTYFYDGLAHFLFGLLFVLGYVKLTKRSEKPAVIFWIGFLMTSSALFILPQRLPFIGNVANKAYQFLHYPVSDWDILLFGFRWHRFFLTHSLLIPLLALAKAGNDERYVPAAHGITIGLASHLIWDGLTGSAITQIVFLSRYVAISGVLAKAWLLVNGVGALILLFIATKVLLRCRQPEVLALPEE